MDNAPEKDKSSKIVNQDKSPHLSDRELLLDIKHDIANKITNVQIIGIISLLLSLASVIIMIIVISRLSLLFWFY